MADLRPIADLDTHRVDNQPPPLDDHDAFAADPLLRAAVEREGAGWALGNLHRFGTLTGTAEARRQGDLANRHPPELRAYDRFGHRIDEVDYHPAYHDLMRLGLEAGVHDVAWTCGRAGGHVVHMALEYLMIQVEAGVCCPLTMNYAAVPALRCQPEVAEEWVPRLLARDYDPRPVPVAEKRAATIGMAMTEKQGGSDVRANTTKAMPLDRAGPGEIYALTGHKWFCSAPMSDAFLTLANASAGLSCFLVPRWRPDGTRNPFRIQRLKDKLGNRANASAEIEYKDTWGQMIGDDGDGVRTIMHMVHHTRLDTALAGAGLMRRALVEAVHHARHRRAFGDRLIEKPLMRNVLADLVVEWAVATIMVARVARTYDAAAEGTDEAEAGFARLAVAVAKYWINKRTVVLIGEAMECLGGGGYIEESALPRLYREAPLNGIWEGSGNVICLDILRTLVRRPEAAERFLAELASARGLEPRLDRTLDRADELLTAVRDGLSAGEAEAEARRLAGTLALAFAGALLVRHGPPAAAEAFCASRLASEVPGSATFGMLPPAADLAALFELVPEDGGGT